MIILANEYNFTNKELKNIPKFIISLDMRNMKENESTMQLDNLFPEGDLIEQIVAKDGISTKKYGKKYKEFLAKSKPSSLLIVMAAIHYLHGNICIVSSKVEQDLYYPEIIASRLNYDYKIKWGYYKADITKEKSDIDLEKLTFDAMDNKHVPEYILNILGTSKKENKKKILKLSRTPKKQEARTLKLGRR